MNKVLLFLIVLSVASLAFADIQVSVGGAGGYITQNSPMIASLTSRFSNNAQLYTAADFVAEGASFPLNLNSIGWTFYEDGVTYFPPAGYGLGTLNVYLKTIADASLATSQNWDSYLAGATLVYTSAAVDLNGPASWRDFAFNSNSPFVYDGLSNLLVICIWNRPASPTPTSAGIWLGDHTQTSHGAFMSRRSVSSASQPLGTAVGSTSYWRPWVRFMAAPNPYGVSVVVDANKGGYRGQTLNYTVTLNNSGLNSDQYSLAVTGNAWQTRLLDGIGGNVITQSNAIAGQGSQTVYIEVTVPTSATLGDADPFILTTTSPNITPNVVNRTTSASYGPIMTSVAAGSHISNNWIDPITGAHTAVSTATSFYGGAVSLDDDAFPVALTEPFNYFGANYSSVGMGTNGTIVFSGTAYNSNTNAINVWPYDGDGTGRVAPQDMYSYYDNTNRLTVLSWYGWPTWNAAANVYTYQVILNHVDGSIKLQYNSFPTGFATAANYLPGPRIGLIHGAVANTVMATIVGASSANIAAEYGGGTVDAGVAIHIFNGEPYTTPLTSNNPNGEGSALPFTPTLPGDPNTGGMPVAGVSFPAQGGANTNPGSVTITYTTTRPGNVPEAQLPLTNTINRYWTITSSTQNFTGAELRLRFTSDDLPVGIVDPITAVPPLSATYSTDGGDNWVPVAGTIQLVGNGIWEFVITGLDHFSMWGVGNAGILPVDLTSFTAVAGDNSVTLNWITESETNNALFKIYRSTSETEPGEQVGQVSGSGNASERHTYRFIDNRVSNGTTYYYRLVDVSFDGIERMHALVRSATPQSAVSSLPTEFALHAAYPNPFNATTEVRYDVPTQGKVSLVVFNVLGQPIAELANREMSAGRYRLTWNATNAAAGVYFLKMNGDGFTSTQKLVLLK